ncbi:uncharacterized protein [Eleutherodactylus coqui]|uniref:uncharacterized protein n=1 Tax=Eleutherodactylus coqui TaxID=57060 RepID=UPI003461AFED
MKSIAIFMLVGLSLFSNGLCGEEATDPSCGCMTTAFKGNTDLLNSIIKALCDYDARMPGAEVNTQLIGAVAANVKTILAPTGCLTKIIDDLESKVNLLANVVSSLDNMGLVSIVRKLVCAVLKRVPVVQCVGNLLNLDKTLGGVTNLAGSTLSALTKLKCAPLNPQSTLDDIMKPLDQLCPGLGQTVIELKEEILKLAAELQKVAEKTCVGALVGNLLGSLSPTVNALLGTAGCLMGTVGQLANGVTGNGLGNAVGGGGGLGSVLGGVLPVGGGGGLGLGGVLPV